MAGCEKADYSMSLSLAMYACSMAFMLRTNGYDIRLKILHREFKVTIFN